jgi:hypothetical protein
MHRGGLTLATLLVIGTIAKLLLPQAQLAPAAPETRSAVISGNPLPPKPQSTEELAKQSTEWYPTQIREKIRDFFGQEHGAELGAKRIKGTEGNKQDAPPCITYFENWCVPSGFQHGVHFVIATAPDPVHTHLGLFFDRTIDAIEQGATNQDYMIDRIIMPWYYFDQPASQQTEQDKLLRKERESYPGLMIFRSEGIDPLFVFVVGETPTAGINKEQFYHAVKIIHEIREGKDCPECAEPIDFGLLGPTFSGSLYSLQKIVEQYLKDYPDTAGTKPRVVPVYTVVMGTQAIEAFAQDRPGAVRMATFEEDGTTALDALLKYVNALDYTDRDVAVLNEDDTAYGTAYGTRPELQPRFSPRVLNLSFPRGISQFRSAYSKDPQNQDQGTDPNQPQRRNLRLNLEVTGGDDDNVAPYAPAQTALSQEAVMLAILSELRQDEPKFILVRATDPLDELFLARYLSQNYSEARLVVPTPDLFFARDEAGLLDGALGLNTYPVSPAYLNPLCDPSKSGGPVIFPAAPSAALFNATNSLLAGLFNTPGAANGKLTPPRGTGAGEPLAPDWNPCGLSPNLWLTIVSRNTFYPIKVLRRTQSSRFFPGTGGASDAEEARRRSGRVPIPWGVACLLCVTLVGLHARRSWTGGTTGRWQTEHGRMGMEKAMILFLGAIILVGMLVVIASTVAPFTPHWTGYLSLLFDLMWLIFLFFTALTAYDFLVRRKRPTLAAIFVGVSALIAVAGILYAYLGNETMVLWQQRALDLATHVSPTTPLLLLLAAFYCWFAYSLKSESLTDWRCPQLPKATDLPQTYYRLTDSQANCIHKVLHPFGGPWWVVGIAAPVVVLLALPGLFIGPGHIPLRSLEGLLFDGIYSLLFGIALFMLITTLLRIVAVWWEFRWMLTALDRPGLGPALQRLRGFEWEVIWNPMRSMQNETRRLVSREIYVAERLRQSLGCPRDTTDPKVVRLRRNLRSVLALRRRLNKLLVKDCPTPSPKAEQVRVPFEELQAKLAQTAGMLCSDFLDQSWRKLPAGDDGDSSQGQGQDSSRAPGQTEDPELDDSSKLSRKSLVLAEEFVACVFGNFIATVLQRVRWLVITSVLIYTAIALSSVSYPFQPAVNLSALALMLFLFGGGVVAFVYEEMHRDVSLRRLTSTDPSKVDTSFWLKFISAGALPLLGLLTSLFPQVGHFLYTIAAPILQATR